MSRIKEALKGLDYPVHHAAYRGNARTFLIFQSVGQEAQLWAEGREVESGSGWSLDLYSDHAPLTPEIGTITQLLADADIRCRVDAVMYDAELDLQHVALSAWAIGREFD